MFCLPQLTRDRAVPRELAEGDDAVAAREGGGSPRVDYKNYNNFSINFEKLDKPRLGGRSGKVDNKLYIY